MEKKRGMKLAFILVILMVSAFISLALFGCGASKTSENDQTTDTNQTEDTGTTNEAPGFQGIAFAREGYIAVANADGSNERTLTSGVAAYGDLAFSPSGNKLAATKLAGDANPLLVSIEVASGKETDISWTNPDYSGAWSSAGVNYWFGSISWASEDTLYCTAEKESNGEPKLYVVKYEISAHRITVLKEDAQNPAVSPDGQELLYIQKPADFMETQGSTWGEADYGDLVLEELGNGSVKTLRGNIFEAVFTPEGEHLGVVSFEEPDTALLVTDLQVNRLYTLSHIGPSGTLSHPSFSPSGDKVIATRGWSDNPGQLPQNNVFICASNSDNPPQTDLGKGLDGAWSPAH